MTRHFLNLSDVGADNLCAILRDAARRKQARAAWPKGKADIDAPLDGYILAMLFEKHSTRTRVSFDVGIQQLGGSAIVLAAEQMQLTRGETMADTARILSRYADLIMIRTSDHRRLADMAENATIPVINGLTDLSHPCQIIADLLTIIENDKIVEGMEVAWLGDVNNVLFSIIEAAGLLRFNVRVGCPPGYGVDATLLAVAQQQGAHITITHQTAEAVVGADVVITDSWVSMGQDILSNKCAGMAPYQVTEELMKTAADDAIFLHCLPAHRGEEVTAAVIDGCQARVWDEAENRVHAQKSIMLWCLDKLVTG